LNAEGAKSSSLLNESFEDEEDDDERLNYLSNQSTTALRHNTLTINKTKSVFDSNQVRVPQPVEPPARKDRKNK